MSKRDKQKNIPILMDCEDWEELSSYFKDLKGNQKYYSAKYIFDRDLLLHSLRQLKEGHTTLFDIKWSKYSTQKEKLLKMAKKVLSENKAQSIDFKELFKTKIHQNQRFFLAGIAKEIIKEMGVTLLLDSDLIEDSGTITLRKITL